MAVINKLTNGRTTVVLGPNTLPAQWPQLT